MDERERLRSDDVQERAAAAEALSLIGTDAAIASVELVKACADDESVSQWSVSALEELGPPPAEAIPELAALASAEHSLVAYWAITLLGRSGDAAQSSQEKLAAILRTSADMSVRQRAAWALGEIHAVSDAAITALQEAAESSDARLARMANASLEKSRV
jgi:HEAT repeat protein